MKLKSLDDAVVVENLADKVEYYDQNGDPWTGAKPKVSFSVETPDKDSWEIKNGNLYLYKTGSYGLWLESGSEFMDRVQVNVEDGSDRTDSANLVIDTFDPETVNLKTDGAEASFHLDVFVDCKTKLGGKYEGIVPELAFTIDGKSPKAALEEHSAVIDEATGETKKYTILTAKESGTYVVHVAPKNAAQYSGKIRDITVKVTAPKKEPEKKVEKPKKAAIKSLKAGKGMLTVTMTAKPSKQGGTHYQVAYQVKGAKKWSNKTTKSAALTMKKLKRGKKYSVKVRAFKIVKGKYYYGAWSQTKTSGKVK